MAGTRTWSTDSTKQGFYGLTEIETASKTLVCCQPSPPHLHYSCQHDVFCATPSSRNQYCSDSSTRSWETLLLCYLVLTLQKCFYLTLLYLLLYFFSSSLLETWSFLKQKWRGRTSGEKEFGGRWMSGGRGNWSECIVCKKNPFLIKI